MTCRYKVTVRTVLFTDYYVDAANEAEAEANYRSGAVGSPDVADEEVYSVECLSDDAEDDAEGELQPPRCDKTLDLFEAKA